MHPHWFVLLGYWTVLQYFGLIDRFPLQLLNIFYFRIFILNDETFNTDLYYRLHFQVYLDNLVLQWVGKCLKKEKFPFDRYDRNEFLPINMCGILRAVSKSSFEVIGYNDRSFLDIFLCRFYREDTFCSYGHSTIWCSLHSMCV